MKTIIESIKAQIEATKNSIEIGEKARKENREERRRAEKEGWAENLLEKLYKDEEEIELALCDETQKLRHLRSALVHMREANGEDLFNIDSFHPEESC